jgi:hypothetical protein
VRQGAVVVVLPPGQSTASGPVGGRRT